MYLIKVPLNGGRGRGSMTLELPDLPEGDRWLLAPEVMKILGVKTPGALVNAENRPLDDAPLRVTRVRGRKVYRLSDVTAYQLAQRPEARKARAQAMRER